MKTYLLSFLLSISIFSMAQNNIVGNGNVTTTTRTVDKNFSEVISKGSMNITIDEGIHDGEISIEGESNIIDYVETIVSNGVLTIQLKSGHNYNLKKKLKVTLSSNHLSSIDIAGSGDVIIKGTQKTKDFSASIRGSGNIDAKVNAITTNLEIMGSGKINISGNATNLTINIRGSGNVKAFDLAANDVKINLAGSGNAHVNCTGNMKINSKGSGSVYYKGNPENVSSKVMGSGKLIDNN